MAYNDKSSFSLCIFPIALGPNVEPITFLGKMPGELVPARGPKDFGWDPIFQPDDDDQMYAEVAKEEKNKISHHSRAVSLAKSHFAEVGYVLQTDNSRRG
ncbi:OLC1v1001121C2 [Oldenlandia corymbosa var. corymbosa]|uniref:OLC1v1001121C2 n=1 Tax=Oldenlandia corymbosa var. corymbosa TaxID=529605 RepID=A0AAV1D5D0_OLDCO|nr:OLC1v1001121C2 [Oldenlandia corymbosa var. corymbosa]